MFRNSSTQNQSSNKEVIVEGIYIFSIESSTIEKNIRQVQNEILKEPNNSTKLGSRESMKLASKCTAELTATLRTQTPAKTK